MVKFVWHASLDLVLHDLVLSLFKEGQELLVGSHDTVVGLVQEEGPPVHVFFYEDHALLFPIFTHCQA